MSQPEYEKYIKNYLDDVTTALPYSDYIRKNIGSYVILPSHLSEKPHIIKGIRFSHRQDTVTQADGYCIMINLQLEGMSQNVGMEIYISKYQIIQLMDKPEILIYLINSKIQRTVKFIAKNKTTDLLFKNEG